MIREYVATNGWATVAEIVVSFKVSASTARRDLDFLARSREVVRVHGGVAAIDAFPWPAHVGIRTARA